MTNQIEVHPFLDQTRVIAACRKYGLSVTAYCPLARGKIPNDDTLERIGKAYGEEPVAGCAALPCATASVESERPIGFDYGQRHRVELEVRQRVRERIVALRPAWAERLGEDHVSHLDAIGKLSQTALTHDMAIEVAADGLPTTFVPGRNLMFFTFAGALAYRRGTKHLVAGMCETDYSGYPDCRDDTIKAMQLALSLGMDRRFVIHTPLMWIDKAATFALAHDIGGEVFVDLLVEDTHTCYLGDRSHRHEWGYGCGDCPACRLRADGFAKWKATR